MRPTLYIDMRNRYGSNPGDILHQTVSMVLGQIGGFEEVKSLVGEGDVEADFALVCDPARALHCMKETETTTIVVLETLLPAIRNEVAAVTSLIERYPGRFRIVDMSNFVASMAKLAAEKGADASADSPR